MNGVDAKPGFSRSLADALAKLPTANGDDFAVVFEHGTLKLEMYAPQGCDAQTPHARDEVYVIARGTGVFECAGTRTRFACGDSLFVPAGAEHRFAEFSDDFATWVMFYGLPGGECPAIDAAVTPWPL